MLLFKVLLFTVPPFCTRVACCTCSKQVGLRDAGGRLGGLPRHHARHHARPRVHGLLPRGLRVSSQRYLKVLLFNGVLFKEVFFRESVKLSFTGLLLKVLLNLLSSKGCSSKCWKVYSSSSTGARRASATWRTHTDAATHARTTTRARLGSQGTQRKFTVLLEGTTLQSGILQRVILQSVSKK